MPDYYALGIVEPFLPDQWTAGYIVIAVVDDDVLEQQENFTLRLETDQCDIINCSVTSETVLTIYDDDSK